MEISPVVLLVLHLLTFSNKIVAGKTVSTPCSYPNPSKKSFHSQCHSPYLGRDNFCDPSATFSRTEADLVMESFAPNFTSCLARATDPVRHWNRIRDQHLRTEGRGQFKGQQRVVKGNVKMMMEDDSKFKLAVVIVATASMNTTVDGSLVYGCNFNMLNHVNLALDRVVEFVRIVSRQWDRKCESDLFVGVVLDWDWNIGVEPQPTLVPLFNRRLRFLSNWPSLQPVFIKHAFPALIQFGSKIQSLMAHPVLRMQLQGIAPSIFDPGQLFRHPYANVYQPRQITTPATSQREETAREKAVRIRLEGRRIPSWAIIVAVICILLAFLGVVCGTLVARIPLKKTVAQRGTPQSATMSMASVAGSAASRPSTNRLRAGFGGGVMSGEQKSDQKPMQQTSMMLKSFKRTGTVRGGATGQAGGGAPKKSGGFL